MTMKRHFIIRAFMTLMLACPVALAPGVAGAAETPGKPGPAPEGQAADDSPLPQTVTDALARLRAYTARQKAAAVAAGQALMEDLEERADDVMKSLNQSGESTREEAEKARRSYGELMADGRARLEELRRSSAEKWNNARDATADALERAAERVRPDARPAPPPAKP